ncbi:MAG: RsmB/NOP family class I SAM-dependent RNA methyltransferase, partial [Novosphingobium sp.]
MTPAARVESAIGLLDAIVIAARDEGAPADRIATDWFKARRYAGSGDRRAVRELAWRAIRACGE